MYQNREELTQRCVQFLESHNASAKAIATHALADDHVYVAATAMDGVFLILAESFGDLTDPQPEAAPLLTWLRETEAIRSAAAHALMRGGSVRYQLLGMKEKDGEVEVSGLGASPKLPWETVFPNLNEVYAEVKASIEHVEGKIETSENLRDVLDEVKALRETLKSATVLKEQRDELFGLLNASSDKLRVKLDEQRSNIEGESQTHFDAYNPQVDAWLEKVQSLTEFKPAREELIALQNEIRQARLTKEHRGLLLDKLDIAFKALRQRQDEDWKTYEAECESNFAKYDPVLTSIAERLETATEFRALRDELIAAQQHIREAKLFREKRQAFYERLDTLFNRLRERQESDRAQFEVKSEENYKQCQTWHEEVRTIVNNTGDGDNYQEAKAQVKALLQKVYDIQPMRMKQKREIIGLIKQEEDRLYTNARSFYERRKQERETFLKDKEEREKNWKQRLKSKINRLEDTISRIETSNEKDKDYLDEIETKLAFVFKGKNVGELKSTYEEKSAQIRNRVAENLNRIEDIQREIHELKQRLKSDAEKPEQGGDDD